MGKGKSLTSKGKEAELKTKQKNKQASKQQNK